jgi:hypothetical protein
VVVVLQIMRRVHGANDEATQNTALILEQIDAEMQKELLLNLS